MAFGAPGQDWPGPKAKPRCRRVAQGAGDDPCARPERDSHVPEVLQREGAVLDPPGRESKIRLSGESSVYSGDWNRVRLGHKRRNMGTAGARGSNSLCLQASHGHNIVYRLGASCSREAHVSRPRTAQAGETGSKPHLLRGPLSEAKRVTLGGRATSPLLTRSDVKKIPFPSRSRIPTGSSHEGVGVVLERIHVEVLQVDVVLLLKLDLVPQNTANPSKASAELRALLRPVCDDL